MYHPHTEGPKHMLAMLGVAHGKSFWVCERQIDTCPVLYYYCCWHRQCKKQSTEVLYVAGLFANQLHLLMHCRSTLEWLLYCSANSYALLLDNLNGQIEGYVWMYYREVYHTKRMQRVIAVQWSLDNKFILSGSEEMNLRVWKANSSTKLGVVHLIFYYWPR